VYVQSESLKAYAVFRSKASQLPDHDGGGVVRMELLIVLLIVGGFVYLLVRSNGRERAGQRTTSIEIIANRGAGLLSEKLLQRAFVAFPAHRDALTPDAFAAWSRELMNSVVNGHATEDDLVRVYRRWEHLLPAFLRGDLPADERQRFETAMVGAFVEMMGELGD